MSNKRNHRRSHWLVTRRAMKRRERLPTLLGLTMYDGQWIELYELGDVLMALPCLPPDEPHPVWVEDAFSVRRVAFITGQCPECGSHDIASADDELDDEVPANHHLAQLVHEDSCAATSEQMVAYCQSYGLRS